VFSRFAIGLVLMGLQPTVFGADSSQPSYDKLNALVLQAQDKQALAQETAGASALDNNNSASSNSNSADAASYHNTVPEPPKKKAPTLRDEAFKHLLDKVSPLTPDQIIEMRKTQDRAEKAVSASPSTPPRPVSSTLTIDLSPGVTPPVIRLSAGFVTSLVFADATGQSWPIADYSLGNPKQFNIQWDKKTNTLFIQSTSTYSSANLAIRLASLDTPVMLSLVSGQREVDYRVDLQVQGRGPNALAPLMNDNLPTGVNQTLLNVLDGVPPQNSQELSITGGPGRAWLYQGKLILRTPLTVLSPAWSATLSSPDGTRVYEMVKTPLVLATQNGKTIKLQLQGL
jgi:intracellular multiplication protein IcmK